MVFPSFAHVHPWLVQERPPILPNPWLVLGYPNYNTCQEGYQNSCLHVASSAAAE